MYKAKEFNIPEIKGISSKQIKEHLKLYNGYVNHVNKISDQVKEWTKNGQEENSYAVQELWRRFGFEFNGMRNHEYYFGALEGGPKKIDTKTAFGEALVKHYESFEKWREIFVHVGKTRGSGWTILYYDNWAKKFIVGWVDEHHLGYLSSLPIIVAMDCWEHAYMVDRLPGERGEYIESYLEAINWEFVENLFVSASQK